MIYVQWYLGNTIFPGELNNPAFRDHLRFEMVYTYIEQASTGNWSIKRLYWCSISCNNSMFENSYDFSWQKLGHQNQLWCPLRITKKDFQWLYTFFSISRQYTRFVFPLKDASNFKVTTSLMLFYHYWAVVFWSPFWIKSNYQQWIPVVLKGMWI